MATQLKQSRCTVNQRDKACFFQPLCLKPFWTFRPQSEIFRIPTLPLTDQVNQTSSKRHSHTYVYEWFWTIPPGCKQNDPYCVCHVISATVNSLLVRPLGDSFWSSCGTGYFVMPSCGIESENALKHWPTMRHPLWFHILPVFSLPVVQSQRKYRCYMKWQTELMIAFSWHIFNISATLHATLKYAIGQNALGYRTSMPNTAKDFETLLFGRWSSLCNNFLTSNSVQKTGRQWIFNFY